MASEVGRFGTVKHYDFKERKHVSFVAQEESGNRH